jgi:hypothetical protein
MGCGLESSCVGCVYGADGAGMASLLPADNQQLIRYLHLFYLVIPLKHLPYLPQEPPLQRAPLLWRQHKKKRRGALGNVCVPFLRRSIELHVANDCYTLFSQTRK